MQSVFTESANDLIIYPGLPLQRLLNVAGHQPSRTGDGGPCSTERHRANSNGLTSLCLYAICAPTLRKFREDNELCGRCGNNCGTDDFGENNHFSQCEIITVN
ncbi:hypothetical protein XENOCAPTIV_001927 [Xenoophorus captivus]|uniref:Uncharacterized protein n=1 Tax=Xenoophorus captivus TaxID=1517983 RepID=A0ABV0QXX9_9TELE